VTLTDELAKLVKQKIDGGLYTSVEEVIAESLKLLDQRDKKLALLRGDIQEGLASGPGRPFDEVVVEDIKKRGRELLSQRKNAG
jgi:antitoxin ParD1/3/4